MHTDKPAFMPGRILKGDLSRVTCQFCSRRSSELVINMKTAKALGLEGARSSLLALADEVIE